MKILIEDSKPVTKPISKKMYQKCPPMKGASRPVVSANGELTQSGDKIAMKVIPKSAEMTKLMKIEKNRGPIVFNLGIRTKYSAPKPEEIKLIPFTVMEGSRPSVVRASPSNKVRKAPARAITEPSTSKPATLLPISKAAAMIKVPLKELKM